MKIKTRYILLTIFTIAATAILFISCGYKANTSDAPAANENLIQTKGFSVNSESTDLNTSASGTVFIKGTDGTPEHVQIVALIEIDPADWGGVAFYIPDNWDISGITSSYPQGLSSTPVNYVSTWTTEDTEYELNKIIEIGRDHSYNPTGGGIGSVVIDLYPDKNAAEQSDTFNIAVAVGSNEKDGIKILESDYILLEIPISNR